MTSIAVAFHSRHKWLNPSITTNKLLKSSLQIRPIIDPMSHLALMVRSWPSAQRHGGHTTLKADLSIASKLEAVAAWQASGKDDIDANGGANEHR